MKKTLVILITMLSLLDGKAEQPILFNRGSIYSISEIKQLPDTGAIIAAKKAIIANANKRLKEEGEMDMVLGLIAIYLGR